MSYLSQHKNNGFTLVELAIVIVIIGLLVGGVLQGQELINQAKIQSIIKNVEGYKGAILTYKSKYGDIPGDSAKTATLFPSLINGNGNGVIDSAHEGMNIWGALSMSKLIKGSSTGYQGSVVITQNIIPTDSNNNYYLFRCSPSTGLLGQGPYGYTGCYFSVPASKNTVYGQFLISDVGSALFTIKDMYALDVKYDDGVASSGNILGTRPTVETGKCASTDAYASGVTNGNYNTLNADNVECVPYFIFNP